MKKLYSLVFQPSDPNLAIINSMKKQLGAKVGTFDSENSVGHITICIFTATEKEIDKIKNQIKKVCEKLTPIEVCLNGFGTFPNGTFFIAPDHNSQNNLKYIMKQFHKSLHIPKMQKISNPHLSIARNLNPENLDIANLIFTSIDLNFVCDSVVLRQFDEKIKQYFVIDTFEFKSNPQPEFIQGTLF